MIISIYQYVTMSETLGVLHYLPPELLIVIVGYLPDYDDVRAILAINGHMNRLVRNCVTVVGMETMEEISPYEIFLLPRLRAIESPLHIVDKNDLQSILKLELEAVHLILSRWLFRSWLKPILNWACNLKNLYYLEVWEDSDIDSDSDDFVEAQNISICDGFVSFHLNDTERYLPQIALLPYEGIVENPTWEDSTWDFLLTSSAVKKLRSSHLITWVMDRIQKYPSITWVSGILLPHHPIKGHKGTRQITHYDEHIRASELRETILTFPRVKTFYVDMKFPSSEEISSPLRECLYDRARNDYKIINTARIKRPDLQIILYNEPPTLPVPKLSTEVIPPPDGDEVGPSEPSLYINYVLIE